MSSKVEIFTRSGKRQTSLLLAAGVFITGLAFAIRLHNLGGDSFWIDELLTVWTVFSGWENMFIVRSHPPLLYLLDFLSLRQFGESEFTFRLPSLYAGVLAIPLIIGLGKAMRRPGAGLLAALLLALSPFHLHHSQEARHYALLMTFTLASYLLLYRAWRRPRWRWWVGYALATTLNLYSHYAAFVVLVAQSVLIAAWSFIQLKQRHIRLLLYPAGAALLVISLFIVRLPQIQRAIQHNIGAGASTSSFNQPAPLFQWMQNFYQAVGAFHPLWKPVLLLFVLLGLLLFLRRREWLNLAFVATGLILPLLLIDATQIDRSAFPRYVIYILPFYLLAAAVGLAEVPRVARQRWGYRVGLVAGMALAGGLLVLSRPLIQAEHEQVTSDWRGIVSTIAEQARPGDVVLPLTLSLQNDWNLAEAAVGYYQPKIARQVTLLPVHRFDHQVSADLAAQNGDVWVVVAYEGGDFAPADPQVDVTEFDHDLYLLHEPHQTGSTLEKVAYYYEQLLPLATVELPACLLRQDLAVLAMQQGDYLRAAQYLGRPDPDCPLTAGNEPALKRAELLARLYPNLQAEMTALLTQGDGPAANQVAEAILRIYPQDEATFSALVVADLLDWFESGRAAATSNSPEPVRRDTFWMPYNQPDDRGDVLFLHAPGRVTYTLSLPPEPALLRFRVGMASHSWEWGGDGSTFIVRVQTEDGGMEELFRRHVSNEAQDRFWHPAELSLAAYAGQTITLTLETMPGPAGDTTGDWALWDSPRIIYDLVE